MSPGVPSLCAVTQTMMGTNKMVIMCRIEIDHVASTARLVPDSSTNHSSADRIVVNSYNKQCCLKCSIKHIHWNGNVAILLKFLSLAALEVVILTNSSAASEENLIKMTTFTFQCKYKGEGYHVNNVMEEKKYLLCINIYVLPVLQGMGLHIDIDNKKHYSTKYIGTVKPLV